MQFTPLETGLISFVFAIIAGLVVRSKCVSEDVCRVQRDGFSEDLKLLFRMVRALVVYSNIPQEEQVDILNDKKGDK